MTVSDFLDRLVTSSLLQVVKNHQACYKLSKTIKLVTSCQKPSSLLQVVKNHQACYKLSKTCFKLVTTDEKHEVRTKAVDNL